MRTDADLTLHSLWADIRAVVARRRKLVAVTTVSAVAVVYIGLLFVSDQYEAQASLLVRLGRENMDVPVTVEHGSIFADGVKKDEVNSQIALLTSTPLVLSTIDAIGVQRFVGPGEPPKGVFALAKYKMKQVVHWGKDQLHSVLVAVALSPRLSQREQARILIEKNLSASAVKDSDVIEVGLRLPDPNLAEDFLGVLMRQYLERHAELGQQADSVADLFDQQAKTYSDRLADLREQSTELKAKLGVSSVTEQKTQLLDLLKGAELADQESERELAKLRAENATLEALRPQFQESMVASAVVGPSAAETKAKEVLAELRVQKAQAMAKYDANTDPIKRLETQIDQLESFTNTIAREDDGPKTYSPNPIVEHMDFQREDDRVKIATLQAGINEGENQITQIKTELQKFDRAETDLQRLQLEISVAETRFTANASKREEARTAEIMDRLKLANVAVLSPPTVSEKPVAPKRLLTVVLALFAGLAMGVGLGLALEWQSDVIHDANDLDRASAGALLGALRQNGSSASETSRVTADSN
jgi:uncharacterized protein involved in exopolysaccharide biosynthesis